MEKITKIKQKSIFTVLDKYQSQINGLFIHLKNNGFDASLIGEVFDENRLFFTIKVPLTQFDQALRCGAVYIASYNCGDIIVIPKTMPTSTAIKHGEEESERLGL